MIRWWPTTWLSGRIGSCVYEQVLREGTEADVLHFVDPGELVELFDELVLPPKVRRTWEEWFERHDEARAEC